jgi:voltage-gated potassium channel
MVQLRAIHVIAAGAIIVIFAMSTALVAMAGAQYGNVFTAALFSFLNIIGTTFPPNALLVDANNPLILSAIALSTAGNLAFTITFTTILYQIFSGIDLKYFMSRQKIRRASRHVIIAPINGIGKALARRLAENKVESVFIDGNRQIVKKAIGEGFLALHGNPASQEKLEEARISDALGVFALSDSDIENTFITISAKKANGKTPVVSRIKRLEDLPKMKRVGASRIIQPEAAVGIEIGNFLLSGARSEE